MVLLLWCYWPRRKRWCAPRFSLLSLLLLRLSLWFYNIIPMHLVCRESSHELNVWTQYIMVCTRAQLFRGKPFDLVSFARREHQNVCCWQIFNRPSATDIYYYCYTRTILCRFKRKFAVRLMWFIYTDSLP